jgi:hypothetical protein
VSVCEIPRYFLWLFKPSCAGLPLYGRRPVDFGPLRSGLPPRLAAVHFYCLKVGYFFSSLCFTWFRGIRVWRCELNALMVFHSHRLRRTGQEEGQTTMQSVNEFLDRSAQMLFLTEIARGFWLTAEVMTKPKVGARSARSPRSRSELTREGGGVSRLPPGRSLSITRSKKAL